jgi:hypothetical protein
MRRPASNGLRGSILSDLLFGAGSVLDLFPIAGGRWELYRRSDHDALRSDAGAVGSDMRWALRCLARPFPPVEAIERTGDNPLRAHADCVS